MTRNRTIAADEPIPVPEMPGYVQFSWHGVQVVIRDWGTRAIREILASGTLYDWGGAQTVSDRLQGRGVSYGLLFPAGTEPGATTAVVVRRNRHGGLLRFVTGDCFLMPTRAPHELATSVRLAAAGVPTPEVIATVVYPLAGILARCDVMTRRLPPGADFPEVWRQTDRAGREQLLVRVAELLLALARGGAWHADLNLKNIYMAGSGDTLQGYVLDVDRVTFPGSGDVGQRNLRRLSRSARKWRERWGLDIGEDDLMLLADLAREKV